MSATTAPAKTSPDGTSERQLRTAVIGCGAGAFHAEAYSADPRSDLIALAGLDTARCNELAAKYGIQRIYRDYQDLLADPDVEAVSLALPNNLHKPVAIAALEAGKHVLVEKPLALNAIEGEEMVVAAERAGKILAIAFNRRYRQDVQLVARHIADGKFGDIYYAKAFWMRRSGIPGFGTWFSSKQLAGGGALIDLGVHVLDMALFMMGNPKVTGVSAQTFSELGRRGKGAWQGGRFHTGEVKFEVDDLAVAFIRLETGAVIQLETSWATYTSQKDDFGVSVMGTEGGAEIYVKDYALVDTLKVISDFEGVPTVSEPRLQPVSGHGEVVKAFVARALDGTGYVPTGAEGLERTRLVDAIYQSAAEGREITFG
ncbi:MAG TPA: Gfo/Idh/MocA family oxidoreductase [Thermomicrobiales bacterium]|nr:Gfo/Idh/MocA family oxidoreductase [Thermomicrobiales bacterium]